MRRRRTRHDLSFEERIAEEAKRLRERAQELPMGKEREELLKKAREADVASHINEWLTSPGLQSPK